MRRLKFRTRLIIGFAIIIVFTLTIGLVALLEISNIAKKTEQIYNHPLAVSNAVRDVNININAIHRTMKDVAMSDSVEQIEKYVNLVQEHDTLIHDAFKIILERFLGEKSVVENTYQAYIDWGNIRNEVIDLKLKGRDVEAARITREKGAQHVELLLDKTAFLSEFAKNKADEFYTKTIEARDRTSSILIVTFIILIALSILVALLISNSISKPIKQLVLELKQSFRMQDSVQENDKNEQELLQETATLLKEAFEKQLSFADELEKLVKERTTELEESENKLKIQNHEYQVLNHEYRAQNEEYLSLNEEYRTQNEELRKAKERAENSDKLKSAFLANMSHEIRTPMNAILGFSELIKRENISKEKREKYHELIDSGGRRLLTIISDIVDISKIDAKQLSLKYSIICINHIIDDLYNQFSLSVTGGVKLITYKDLDNEECYVKTDETRIVQILSNLLENAIKFTSSGEIQFGYRKRNDLLEFFVKDTGIGISKENQKLIFERFRQVDNDFSRTGSGTGLGLAIVKGLTDLFHGDVWIESELKKGTTFYFTIPFDKIEKPKITKAGAASTIKKDDSVTILIAEDEQTNFMYLKELFSVYNFHILHAQNGREAVDMYSDNQNIDLILMDIKMPVLNGLEATREIRKINKKVPIVAQTAYAMEEDRYRALDYGCNDYISKPITIQKMEDIIASYIENSTS